MIHPETLLKALVDETRLRCVMLLLSEGELCVCELGHALQEVQPKISRHLGILREGQVVQDRRAGQWVYYRLHPDLPEWSLMLLRTLATGLHHSSTHQQDRQRLLTMADRPSRCMNACFSI